MKITLIIAGNFKEFCLWCKDSFGESDHKTIFSKTKGELRVGNDQIYRYISEPIQMRGFHDVNVEFVGSYLKKANLDEFMEAAKFARMKCPKAIVKEDE